MLRRSRLMRLLARRGHGRYPRAMTNELKAAVWTTLWTFVGAALLALTGFLNAVMSFLTGTNETLADDVSNLGVLLASALVAAAAGFLNLVYRVLQSHGKLPGQSVSYGPRES